MARHQKKSRVKHRAVKVRDAHGRVVRRNISKRGPKTVEGLVVAKRVNGKATLVKGTIERWA
jgi:hypothetical protein